MQYATLVAGAMETALANLLRFHPEPAPLACWQGQVIKIQLKELAFPLFLILRDPIQIYSQYSGDLDAQLSVSLSVLKQLSQGAPLSALVKDGALEIQGDLQLLSKLINMLSVIEPDLTEPLSQILGDGMAYRVDQFGRATLKRLNHDVIRLQQHSAEVLREELRLAPCAREVAEFGRQVDALSQRVAALTLKIDAQEGTA